MASVERTIGDAFTTALQAVPSSLVADEAGRTVVRLLGVEAVVCYRLDTHEHARRQAAGAGAICSADVLELLLGLPAGMPVPVASLTRREHAALAAAPRGSVLSRDGFVTRLAVPPVTVELALVVARSWRKGLVAAGRFAPFTARAMVLHRRPRELAELRLQAGFYGVGVILPAEHQPAELLVEPAPFQRHRFTAAGWRFLETVYRHAVASTPGGSGSSDQPSRIEPDPCPQSSI